MNPEKAAFLTEAAVCLAMIRPFHPLVQTLCMLFLHTRVNMAQFTYSQTVCLCTFVDGDLIAHFIMAML